MLWNRGARSGLTVLNTRGTVERIPRMAQCCIGITTGPGGAELILAGDVIPLIEIEMGYKPGGSEVKSCGTVRLIWNSPGPTSTAALAEIVTLPMVTVTPLNSVCETKVPAGDAARPVA